MSGKDDKLVSIYTYWKKMVLLPSVIAAISVCLCAIVSLKIIEKRRHLNELQKIAWTISELIYDKIDATKIEGLTEIVYDVGRLHNVIITIESPSGETVASYPGVISLINKSLPFDLVYKEKIELENGYILGQVTIKKTKRFSFQVDDWVLFGSVVFILIVSLIWQLRFSRPMVSAIKNLSLDNSNCNDLKFIEVCAICRLLKKQAQELRNRELKKSAEARAIAQMSQMIAHDIRLPFIQLDGVMSLLETAENSTETKEITNEYMPQVRSTLLSVDNMLSDIIEAGSLKPPDKKPNSIESIIESVLNDCFRFDEKSNILFEYDFKHEHQVNVDRLKIFRVFCNIVKNAVQAMNFKGTIWFRTREMKESVTITIGNAGTYIPKEVREHLFEQFYTKNSNGGGTGLGLAIAEKIVISHGGHIVCRSDRKNGTEFEFDLPVAMGKIAHTVRQLPVSNSQLKRSATPYYT